jgi:DNA-binding CsgD family transcriptional regulator
MPLEPLAVGTAGPGWVLERVSAEIREIIGWDPQDGIDRPFLADVHPDDAGDLVRYVEELNVEDMVARRLRLRHRDGHWVAVQALLVRLSDDVPPRLAFAIMPDHVDTPLASAERVSELEKRLRRIAAELRAAGVMEGVDRLPAAGDHPELNQLSTRQWQILVRLLRGDRVPTMARELHLSPSTVRNHLTAIFSRFSVHSQAALIALLRPR